jgi:hypothetical protein
MGGPFDERADDKTMEKTTDKTTDKPDPKPDYERDLGVIEAITVVTRSCPNGGVIAAAERALDAIKAGGPDTLKEQAYFVLTAIQGWRGDRARQVHRSLTRYLDPNALDNRN